MPRRRGRAKRRSYRSRSRKRRSRKRMRPRNKMSFRRMPLLTPDVMYCKLKFYNENRSIVGSEDVRIFRGNSLFDPEESLGISQQPVGFDEYAAMYNNYEVMASSIRLEAVNLATIPVRFVIHPSFSELDVAVDSAMGNPYSKKRIVGSSLAGPSIIRMSNFMRTKKYFGRQTNDLNFQATVLQNPVNDWFWHVSRQSMDFTSTLNVTVAYTLIYYCKFFRRRMIADG